MATIRYGDGRGKVTGVTVDEARDILERECEVVEECGDRWLAWATEADAADDDGSRAVAEIVGD